MSEQRRRALERAANRCERCKRQGMEFGYLTPREGRFVPCSGFELQQRVRHGFRECRIALSVETRTGGGLVVLCQFCKENPEAMAPVNHQEEMFK